MLSLLLAITLATDDPAPAPEVVPSELETARRIIRDQTESGPSGWVTRSLQTINREGNKSDIKLLMTLRGDKRIMVLHDDEVESQYQAMARVGESAAAIALRLAGQKVDDFGFRETKTPVLGKPDRLSYHWQFRGPAAREEAAKKGWNWLDKNSAKK